MELIIFVVEFEIVKWLMSKKIIKRIVATKLTVNGIENISINNIPAISDNTIFSNGKYDNLYCIF